MIRDLSGICQGESAMFTANCVEGSADNSAESHSYYVRMPAACKGCVPAAEVLAEDGDVVRVITEPVSVKAMHEAAASVRAGGGKLFFAALRG